LIHIALPGWNDLETARTAKSFLEFGAIVFFALLVLFEILAHANAKRAKRKRVFDITALICFAVAVVFEAFAHPYSRRVDTLADEKIASAEAKIAPLNQPIRSLSASVVLRQSGLNPIELTNQERFFVTLDFADSKTYSPGRWPVHLICTSFEKCLAHRGLSVDTWWYLEFDLTGVANEGWSSVPEVPAKMANEWDLVMISAYFLRTGDVIVGGGKITLRVNQSTIKREIPIPPHTVAQPFGAIMITNRVSAGNP
jgi:hypothetical protein